MKSINIKSQKELFNRVKPALRCKKHELFSCGVNYIYDGTFTGNKIKGMGITTRELNKRNIKRVKILSAKEEETKNNGLEFKPLFFAYF